MTVESHKAEQIDINKGKNSTHILVNDVPSEIVNQMYKQIHYHESQTKFFEVPLYCKTVRDTTPVKNPNSASDQSENEETASENQPEVSAVLKKKEKKVIKSKESFLIRSSSSQLKKSDKNDVTEDFVFSDNEQDIESETDTGDESFEICARDTDHLGATGAASMRRNSFNENLSNFKKRVATSPLLKDKKTKLSRKLQKQVQSSK